MGKKKILVVDYDQSTLVTLQQILTGEGYEVILAGDGQVAWDKYNQEDPDLVLMEAMLSKIHGFELCQRITSVHERRVPVFIMTGVYKDRVYRTEALRSYGASEYFEKPLKIAEILNSIETVIGKPGPEPAPEPEPAEPEADVFAKTPQPAAAMREAVPAEPRKPGKPKAVDEESRWAFDLASLEKEVPKIMAVPSPRAAKKKGSEPPEDEIDLVAAVLKSYPTIQAENPQDQKNNGNDGIEIDNILKSALADLDLSADKKMTPKTITKTEPSPQPPQPVKPKTAAPPAAPPIEKPRPVAPRESVAPPSPAERMRPVPPRPVPQAPPPARPVEKPKVAAPPPRPAPAPAPAPKPKPRAEEQSGRESRTPDWERPAPAAAPTELRRFVLEDAKLRQKVPSEIFEDLYKKKSRPAFPPLLAGGAAVVVLAVAAFFVFRPAPAPPLPVNPAAAAVLEAPAVVEPMPETALPPPAVAEPESKQPAPDPKPPAPAPKKAAPIETAPEAPAEEKADAGLIAPITPTVNPGLALQIPDFRKPDEKKPEPPPIKAEETALPDTGGTEAAAAAPAVPVTPVNEGDLVDLLEVDKPPSVVRRVEPAYPQAALRLGVEGTITVNALIDETGKVIDTGILRGMKDDRGLEKAAQAAVRRWRFDPARKSGVNVKVWVPIVIVFRIGDGDTNPENR